MENSQRKPINAQRLIDTLATTPFIVYAIVTTPLEREEMLAWKLSGLGAIYLIGLLANLALILGVKMRLPILFVPWLVCSFLAISGSLSTCASALITALSTPDEIIKLNFMW